VKVKTTKIFLIIISSVLAWTCSDEETIRMAIEEMPHGFDPVYQGGVYDVQIQSQIFETLLRLDSDCQTILPNLVMSWTVNPDGNTYRFTLRPDVRFQDGHRLNVNDILYSIERYRTEKNNWLLQNRIEHVSVIDSLTFEIRLKKNFAPFLYTLCSPYILMIQSPVGEKDKNLSGTGPYILDESHRNGRVILRQNPLYWQKSSEVKKIEFILYLNYDSSAYAIEDREVDIVYLISGSIIDRLKWTGKIDYVLNKPLNIIFIGFNNQAVPFNDLRIRKAVLYTLNIPQLVYNSNRGNAIPAAGPLPPIYNLETPLQAGQDLALARKLLKETEINGNLVSRFYVLSNKSSRQTGIELLKAQLRASGITLQTEVSRSWPEHIGAIMSDRAQMFMDGYDSDIIGDPWYFLWTLFHSKSPSNSLKYYNSTVDSLLDLAETRYDMNERKRIYEKIVSIIIAETPAIFLDHVIPHFAVDSERIKHISVSPYQILDFNSLILNKHN
jgi:peptide/nickel transport system substrate-binding protein